MMNLQVKVVYIKILCVTMLFVCVCVCVYLMYILNKPSCRQTCTVHQLTIIFCRTSVTLHSGMFMSCMYVCMYVCVCVHHVYVHDMCTYPLGATGEQAKEESPVGFLTFSLFSRHFLFRVLTGSQCYRCMLLSKCSTTSLWVIQFRFPSYLI